MTVFSAAPMTGKSGTQQPAKGGRAEESRTPSAEKQEKREEGRTPSQAKEQAPARPRLMKCIFCTKYSNTKSIILLIIVAMQ